MIKNIMGIVGLGIALVAIGLSISTVIKDLSIKKDTIYCECMIDPIKNPCNKQCVIEAIQRNDVELAKKIVKYYNFKMEDK